MKTLQISLTDIMHAHLRNHCRIESSVLPRAHEVTSLSRIRCVPFLLFTDPFLLPVLPCALTEIADRHDSTPVSEDTDRDGSTGCAGLRKMYNAWIPRGKTELSA